MAATQLPASQHPITVNSGAKMHQLGFGTWQAKTGEVATAVEVALKAGFRHIDGAMIYRNEGEVGQAVAKCIAEGVVKREDLFITTKLWNIHHEPAQVRPALEASLKRLGLDYIDLYLIHWPAAWSCEQQAGDHANIGDAIVFPRNDKGGCHTTNASLIETYKAMEPLVAAGLTRGIGISNTSLEQSKEVFAAAAVKPIAIQVECHPCLPQAALREFCAANGIALQAYCPLGIGMLDSSKSLLQHPSIAKVAEVNSMTAAELLLRWNVTKGNVTLSKSVTPERIAQNAATPTEPLSADLMAALDEFGAANPLRVCNPDFFYAEGPKPFFGADAPGSF
jgi:diketogulonate reductase-like aldo/keto reductase